MSCTHRHVLLVLTGVAAFFGVLTVVYSSAVASQDQRGYWTKADQDGIQERVAVEAGYAHGQTVLGPDDRINITETDQFPWSAIVFLELYDEYGPSGSCTGTFVGPDTILTAAHCLWSASDGWTANIAIVPGKNGASEPFGYEWAASWWVPDAWVEAGEPSEWDWGVIRLESTALGGQTGSLYIAHLRTSSLTDSLFWPAVVGYPGDKATGTLWGAIAPSFDAVEDFFLYYDIDIYFGQSGSAIFSANPDSPWLGAIVGVVTQGAPDINRGTRVDSEFLADVLHACDLLSCTVQYYVEPAGPAATSTPTPTLTPTAIATIANAAHWLFAPGVVRMPSPGGTTPTPSPSPAPSPTQAPGGSATIPAGPVPARPVPSVAPPKPSPTPTLPPVDTSAAVRQLWTWYDEVGALYDTFSSIWGDEYGGFLTHYQAAVLFEAHSQTALNYKTNLEAMTTVLLGYPTVCDQAREYIALSAGWLGIMSGWVALIHYDWPYADYFAELEEASDAYFATRQTSLDLVGQCGGP